MLRALSSRTPMITDRACGHHRVSSPVLVPRRGYREQYPHATLDSGNITADVTAGSRARSSMLEAISDFFPLFLVVAFIVPDGYDRELAARARSYVRNRTQAHEVRRRTAERRQRNKTTAVKISTEKPSSVGQANNDGKKPRPGSSV